MIALSNQASSIYIHIPFCKSKCHYCNFLSFTDKNDYNEYIQTLCSQIKSELKSDVPIKTIYIGGGTPSILSIANLKDIFTTIKDIVVFDKNIEITVEVNPATVDYDYLKKLRECGVNRLSIGVQSFNDKFLKSINRLHTSINAKQTIDDAKKAGFNNISIDLIYGLPNQTAEDWKNELQIACKQDIQHISAYGLKVEEDTYFGKNPPKNIPEEDECAKIFLDTGDILAKNGFSQYEISNYSKEKSQSKHNLTYWNNKEYYGFGLGAHGYVNNERYSNTCDLDKYLINPTLKNTITLVSPQEKLEEEIFLGLRLTCGIAIESINKKFHINFLEKYKIILERHSKKDLIMFDNNTVKLTPQGFLLSNYVLADFLG